MRRRRPPPPRDSDGIPEWVKHFDYQQWADETEQPPPWRTDPHAWPSWWLIRAWRRWQDACRQWATDHPGVDLFALHYSDTSANLIAARRGWFGMAEPPS